MLGEDLTRLVDHAAGREAAAVDETKPEAVINSVSCRIPPSRTAGALDVAVGTGGRGAAAMPAQLSVSCGYSVAPPARTAAIGSTETVAAGPHSSHGS